MKRLIILNGQLIFPDRIDTGKALICKNGKIEQILADKMLEINPDDQIIDAKQQYVSPGFIDMHGRNSRGISKNSGSSCEVWNNSYGAYNSDLHR